MGVMIGLRSQLSHPKYGNKMLAKTTETITVPKVIHHTNHSVRFIARFYLSKKDP